MSSPTSGSFVNTLFDTITAGLAKLQGRKFFTKERFQSGRQYIFQSIGFSILFYSFLQLTFRILSIIFWLPLKTIKLLLPKTNNYVILFPLFCLFSIVSYFIARFSHNSVNRHLRKHFTLTKNYSFILVFMILLVLQSVFILRPIAVSIQEQRKFTLNSAVGKQTVIKLSNKEIVQPNTFINNNGNSKRELNDDKREEYASITNRVKSNDTDKRKISSSSSLQNDIESDVEDEQSYVNGHVKQDMVVVEKSVTNLPFKVSSDEEEELLLKQQANNLVNPNHQFSSKSLHESPVKSKSEGQESLTFHQKFDGWLDEVWNKIKPDFQQRHFLSTKQTQHLPHDGVSSIYTAYTDLNCYEDTEIINYYRLIKQKYIDFLNAYRHQSPFPVYLSILKSNGPKCYPQYPTSSCAIGSKTFFQSFKRQLYRFIRFWVIITIPVILFITLLTYRQHHKKPNTSSTTNQQIISDKTNDLLLQQTSPNINKNYPLDEEIERELYSWFEHKQHDNYQSISETCRIALNDIFLKQYTFFQSTSSSLLNCLLNSPSSIQQCFLNEFLYSLNQEFLYKKEQLYIERLQFTNANIHDISQTSVEPPVIKAILNIDYLILNIINPIKDQHYLAELRKLTGELQIFVINNIEVKFKQIQIDSTEIVDPQNFLSSDEKQSIIKLLTDIINQTVVQFCVHALDNPVNEPKTPPSTPQIVSQPSDIYQQPEIPLVSPTTDNNQQIVPQKEAKKLLVSIVKAVKLYDVEQPFCILELNHPKQIHETSIAKNGLNPFWNERFLFECNDKSNEIRLQIIDRKKPNKKLNTKTTDKPYADVSIPFSYVTSTIYKQDVRITPKYPESIIRIEFSTLTEEQAITADNGFDIESITNSLNWSNISREANKTEREQSPSDEILILPYSTDVSPKDYNVHSYVSALPRSTTDTFITPPNDDIQLSKSRKSRSFMSSLRHFTLPRRKKHQKNGKQSENGVISPANTSTQTNSISHSLSAEPFLYPNTAEPISFPRHHSFRQSFTNLFRSSSKKKTLNTTNFIIDHPDLLCTSTPTKKKRSFLQRFKPKPKRLPIASSTNSLTSYDCTRTESVQNTPVRANGNRPVTMTKPLV